jgi:hypothetical protein
MRVLILCLLLSVGFSSFGQTIKVYDDFHFIPCIDSSKGIMKYMTNTIVSELNNNGKTIHIEGDLVKSFISIDTSFTTLEIIEAGIKKSYKLEINLIEEFDNSYTENDTLFQLIDKDLHLTMDNGFKLYMRYTNQKLFFIKIFEDKYIVDYSFVKPENVERFYDVLEYNKEVINNNEKDQN